MSAKIAIEYMFVVAAILAIFAAGGIAVTDVEADSGSDESASTDPGTALDCLNLVVSFLSGVIDGVVDSIVDLVGFVIDGLRPLMTAIWSLFSNLSSIAGGCAS